MKRLLAYILTFFIILPTFSQHWQETDTLFKLTPEQADSLFFRFSHHYTVNSNFLISADSLTLIPHESDFMDTCYVYDKDVVVVADIRPTNTDTVWIKLFRDQMTMGWVTEHDLLESATPDDVISQIINYFSKHMHLAYLVVALLLVIGSMFFKLSKLYSVLSVLTTLGITINLWYVIVQEPDFWLEYYFHPTLNPFILPTEMMTAVIIFWLACIINIALLFVLSDYLSRKLNLTDD